MQKLNILCLDIEGGHGGSSKSLYNSIKYINQDKFKPIVICKKNGLLDKYAEIGIKCFVDKTMPTFTALRKQNRNILYYFFFKLYLWPRSITFRKNLLDIIDRYKIHIVHCNLISLFLLAKWLKKEKPYLIFTLHVRTNPVNTYTGRYQAKVSHKIFSNKIFITENEREKMNVLIYPEKTDGELIYNSVEIKKDLIKPKYAKKLKTIKIFSLSNYSYPRGTDRIIDLAEAIPLKERKKFIFYIAGDNRLPRFLPGKLKILGLMGKSLKDYAKLKKVSEMFRFMGHVKNVDELINESNILIRPTREYNPWGRDVLEAMSAGKAVISVGKYDKFVKTNFTGLLQEEFNIEELVEWLLKISKNTHYLISYGKNSLDVIKKLNDPCKNALKLEKFWSRTLNDNKVVK